MHGLQLTVDLCLNPDWFSYGCRLPPVVPERILKGEENEKHFWSCPLIFFGSKSTTSRSGERFPGDPYSLVSLLFAVVLLTVPTVPSH